MIDNYPYNIEAAQALVIEWSPDIEWDFEEGYPSVDDSVFSWSRTFTGIGLDINFYHVWMRYKIGKKGSWVGPIKMKGSDGTIGGITTEETSALIAQMFDTISADEPIFFINNVISHKATEGFKHIPAGGTVGQILSKTGVGVDGWIDNQDLSVFYTKTELQTSGSSLVHWDNITNVGLATIRDLGGDTIFSVDTVGDGSGNFAQLTVPAAVGTTAFKINNGTDDVFDVTAKGAITALDLLTVKARTSGGAGNIFVGKDVDDFNNFTVGDDGKLSLANGSTNLVTLTPDISGNLIQASKGKQTFKTNISTEVFNITSTFATFKLPIVSEGAILLFKAGSLATQPQIDSYTGGTDYGVKITTVHSATENDVLDISPQGTLGLNTSNTPYLFEFKNGAYGYSLDDVCLPTNGTPTIINGEKFYEQFKAGKKIDLGGVEYTILTVDSDTTLTLTTNYLGASVNTIYKQAAEEIENKMAMTRYGHLDLSDGAGVSPDRLRVGGDINVTGVYKAGGVTGFTGTGAYTNFTIVGGIITAAS